MPCVNDDLYDLDSNIRKLTNANRNNSCNSQQLMNSVRSKKFSSVTPTSRGSTTIATSPRLTSSFNEASLTRSLNLLKKKQQQQKKFKYATVSGGTGTNGDVNDVGNDSMVTEDGSKKKNKKKMLSINGDSIKFKFDNVPSRIDEDWAMLLILVDQDRNNTVWNNVQDWVKKYRSCCYSPPELEPKIVFYVKTNYQKSKFLVAIFILIILV